MYQGVFLTGTFHGGNSQLPGSLPFIFAGFLYFVLNNQLRHIIHRAKLYLILAPAWIILYLNTRFLPDRLQNRDLQTKKDEVKVCVKDLETILL